MARVRRLKFFLWAFTGLAAAVGVYRFLFGLGATTNLSDGYPWGVWIGFDVMSGVALAAGGFIVTATVYIFKLERFHPIVRPAVLTAFLGYAAVAVGLLFDLGLPWNIWHMLIYWNPHSPLFEVGWCVMLYLTVLTLEFLPVPAEEISRLASVRRFLVKIRLPLVIAGIGLSTLHQSSLGSLFLIMPEYLHPLWYSPILPVLFFISAVGLGLAMVIFESHTTAYFYYRKPETSLLAPLAGAARWVLIGYLAVRFGDLTYRGQLQRLAEPGWQTYWFWFELAVMAFIPIVIFSLPRTRRHRTWQWVGAAFGVAGVVLNRVNVGGLMHQGRGDRLYLPSWTEITISAGIVSAAVLAFLFFIERFRVWQERPVDPEADPKKLPELSAVGATWLGVPVVANRTVYSLAFVGAAALGFALIQPQPASTRGIVPVPVHEARGADVLWIDGNLDGYGVAFPHADHEKREGGKKSCARCHHMNLPRDKASACAECHRDMYAPSDAFRHDWHAGPQGAALACAKCHALGKPRSKDTAKTCDQCHKDLVAEGAVIEVKQYQAPSYTEAMHRLCVGCHVERAAALNKPDMPRCAWCHKERRRFIDAPDVDFRGLRAPGSEVVLPPLPERK